MARHLHHATLRCRCGTVRGAVAKAGRWSVNRVICFCHDCQAFAHYLGRADLLDRNGGSDIVQVAAGRVKLTEGMDKIRGVRLTPSGTYRWFAACCCTPIGNMASLGQPGLGIHATAFVTQRQHPDVLFGEPIGGIRGESALGGTPQRESIGLPLRVLAKAVPTMLLWRLRRLGRPNPFLGEDGLPLYPVEVTRE